MNVVLIPARWNSSRFPGKPLHVIAGKPLLQHVWERCCRARKIHRTIIATDHMRVAEAAFAWGAEVALTSPAHQSGTDRIAEIVERAKRFSLIVNVQGDEPLIDPKLIDRIVSTFSENRAIQIITAAHPFNDAEQTSSPHQVKVVTDRAGNALYFSRACIPFLRNKNASCQVLRHQGVYGFRRAALLQLVRWAAGPLEKAESLEQLRALENGVKIHVLVIKQGSPGVDTPADVAVVARLLRQTNVSPTGRRLDRMTRS